MPSSHKQSSALQYGTNDEKIENTKGKKKKNEISSIRAWYKSPTLESFQEVFLMLRKNLVCTL